MKAIEFKTKLKNNKILIPKKVQNQITAPRNKNVRVIVLMDELNQEEDEFRMLTRKQFLKGYAKQDSVYDNY